MSAGAEWAARSGPLPGRGLVGPCERRIAEIWSAALGMPVTDGGHDFFSCGGDSFQATLAIVQVRREWGLDITVGLLIEEPTLSGFAARVARSVTPRGDDPH